MIVTESKNRKIKICDQILEEIYSQIQKNDYDPEKGGIIVGRENLNNENIILEYISKPLKNDIFDDGQILLPDGSLILIENNGSSGRIFITVDINGVNKKPNIWGRDLFTFEITSKGKLLPMGAEGTSYTNMSVYCSKNSNDTFNGIACTASALSDKDYFKKMY